jgi:hypothetical protein
VVRRRLILTLVSLLVPVAGAAQSLGNQFTSFTTVFIGASHGGDATDVGLTPGVSSAVVDSRGLGAEIDLSHAREFDSERFVESGITTFLANFTWIWPDPRARYRPYLVFGAGVLRVRACDEDCAPRVSRTDWAVDAGGGMFYMFSENFGLRGDLRYFRYVQHHGDVPLTDNGFFDFWRTSGGVVFSWPVR